MRTYDTRQRGCGKHDPNTSFDYLGALLFAWYYRDDDLDVLAWSSKALSTVAGSPLSRAQVTLSRLTVLMWQRADSEEQVHLFEVVHEHIPGLGDAEWERRWRTCEAWRKLQASDSSAATSWLDDYPADTIRARLRKAMLKTEILGHSDRRSAEQAVMDEWLGTPDLAAHTDYHVTFLSNAGYGALREGRLDDAAASLVKALELSRSALTDRPCGEQPRLPRAGTE